jgi:hypothetical protein
MMKISNKIVGALLLALVFSACKDGSPAADEPILQKSTLAKVVVNVDGVARTLVPDATGLKYRLVISNYSKIESDEEIPGSSITKELESGDWNITVWALKDDDSLVGSATASANLKAGETKNVSLTIQPLTDQEAGAGTFSWDFVLPEEEGLYTEFNTKNLTPNTNTANTNAIALVEDSGSLELPAGRYTLDVTAVSNRSINNSPLKAVRKEVVYIYPHLTTNAPFTFDVADFGAEMYFSGKANIYLHNDITTAYTPTEVELQLADDTVKTAPITLDTDNGSYVWAIEDVASNEINNSLSTAYFRFTATATGNKVIHSPWQPVYLEELSGATDISLTANVYKIDTSNLALYKGGTVTIPSEAAWGDQVTMAVKPNQYYGIDETNIFNWASAHYTGSDSDGRKYEFTMSDYEKTFQFNMFFRIEGGITITGTGYKPTKIEAWEITEGDEPIETKIGEYTPATPVEGKYGWRIDPGTYVYNNVQGEQKKIELRVTLTSDNGNTSYTVKETRDISSLYEESIVDLPISLYEIYNFKTSPETIEAITLSWDKADWAAGGYNIYRRTGIAEYAKVNANPIPIATTTYKDSTVSVNIVYDYYIVGVSGEAVKTYLLGKKLQYPTPANVTATFNGGYPLQNYITWDAVPPSGSYQIRYRILRNGTEIGSTANTSYNDSNNLYFNSTYTYTVVAYNSTYGNDSETSAATSAITTPPLSSYYGGSFSPYIASGEYQYYQVDDSWNWNSSYFSLNYTNVYLYVRLYSDYSSNSGYNESFGIYNNKNSVILIVQNQSSYSGNYTFSVGSN